MAASASPHSPGRCAIFFYEGYLGVSPTNVNLAKALAQAGYDVTIYTRSRRDAPDAGELPGVKVVRLRPGRIAGLANRLVPFTTSLLFMLRGLAAELWVAAKGGGRTVYVGVDIQGGMAAALSSAVLRRRFVFVSLELRIAPEQKRGVRGALARLAYRHAAAVLAQGPDRFELLAREFGWRHKTTFTLPNSPFADAPAAPPAGGENLFRAKFAIPAGERIAVQAGMINKITCCDALAKGFAGVGDWALVLHERFKRSPDEPYLAALRASNSRNLYLSLDPLPYDQVDQVFVAADVGLAFYQPETADDDNFRFISSSGKLPHYLKHGKPVLVSDLPPLVELIEAYHCGLVVENPADPSEVGAALRRIASRYDEFSRNAARCFSERYEFGKGVEPVIKLMADL